MAKREMPVLQIDKTAADVRLATMAIAAVVAALPSTANVDIERVNTILKAMIGPDPGNSQIARAMYFAQELPAHAAAVKTGGTVRRSKF